MNRKLNANNNFNFHGNKRDPSADIISINHFHNNIIARSRAVNGNQSIVSSGVNS